MVGESLKKKMKYMLTKDMKIVLWGVAVHLSYIEDAWYLKVNSLRGRGFGQIILSRVLDTFYILHNVKLLLSG